MSTESNENTTVKEEQKGMQEHENVFSLFVAGKSQKSLRAIVNIKAICEKYLKGKYKLDIIDIYEQPLLAVTENIIAVPVLVKKFPLPEERMVGDLSDTQSVLNGLYLI